MEESNINVIIASDGCEKAKGTCVVFDVLRASSVECHLHLVGALKVFPQETVEETLEMKKKNKDAILLGEREGEKIEGFDFGNSQSEILKNADKIKGKICYHNTTAGTQAINKCIENKNVKEVLVASPNNFEATLKYLKKYEQKEFITLVAAGSLSYCLEDFLICNYFKALLLDQKPELSLEEIIAKVKETTGAKFFKNISYYPPIDFDLAFKLNVLNKVLKVVGNETVSIDV